MVWLGLQQLREEEQEGGNQYRKGSVVTTDEPVECQYCYQLETTTTSCSHYYSCRMATTTSMDVVVCIQYIHLTDLG